jgi:streptomycin 6-kinase
LIARLEERIREWRVRVDEVVRTQDSVVAFGRRGEAHVVLKVVERTGNEWRAGEVLDAFDGRGVVRGLEHGEGAVLLERLRPGRPLASEPIDDDEATTILADVIGRMSPGPAPGDAPTVEAWGASFERYLASGGWEIPRDLVEEARKAYLDLCVTQALPRLLHGDLHHHNVLLDSQRGWLAIDPKGVVGEPAYEVGAALRNPCDRPELFAAPETIRRRADRYTRELRLDGGRVLGWAFAQAVLAAIWEIEDEGRLRVGEGWLRLAAAIRPMLDAGRTRWRGP